MAGEQTPHILIVDDEQLNLEIISEYLADCDYRISTAEDGEIAWSMLEKHPQSFDVILLDRMMPNVSGLKVLERIKEHEILKNCPVIFQTAKASHDDILEGISAGAYYYLTKPFAEEMLLSIVNTAVNDRLRFKKLQTDLHQTKQTMGLLKSASFDFQTPDEARAIASLISNACTDPEKVVLGLTELMINAIEHGNLAITYEEKSVLNASGEWEQEVEKRLAQAENTEKFARIQFNNHQHEGIQIIITDQGQGFDWQNYLDFAPDRAMDNHGRGIAMANKLSFNHIEYKGNGNEVHAFL